VWSSRDGVVAYALYEKTKVPRSPAADVELRELYFEVRLERSMRDVLWRRHHGPWPQWSLGLPT